MSKKRLKRTLNNNSIPFIVLLIVHFLVLAFTFYKKRDKKSYLVLLLSNIGFAYLFEYFVLHLLRGYRYYPKLLKNRTFDNYLGAIFSQAIYVPIIATTITAFRLGWKWKLVFSVYFVLIERLFISLKVFRQRWWKTYYTFFFLLLFFKGSDIWHRLLKSNHPIGKGITSYLSSYSYNVTVYFILAVFNLLKMGLGVVHSWKEHFIIVPIYAFIISAINMTTYKIRSQYSNSLGFILVLIIDYMLFSFKLFKNRRTILILFPIHIVMFFFSTKLFNMIYGVGSNKEL